MKKAIENKTDFGFTQSQLESLTGKSYDRLKVEAKETRKEIAKFIHHYDEEPNKLLSLLVNK